MKLVRENLHVCSLNKHFPHAVLYGPLCYGGLGVIPLHTKHIADKALYFLHHLGLQDNTGLQMLAAMGFMQLECGVDTPFSDLDYKEWGGRCLHT